MGTEGEGGSRGKNPKTPTPTPTPTEDLTDRERVMMPGRKKRRQARRRMRGMKKVEERTERPHRGPWLRSLAWGGTPPPGGKRGPPGIHP